MILVINLKEDEVHDFSLYNAIIYVWLNVDSVTQYDDMKAFKKNYKEHITEVNGHNYVGVIDTDNNSYEIMDIDINGIITESKERK